MYQQLSLIGNLGGDPELKESASGRKVVNMSVAVNERWADDDGTKHERTEWFDIEAWGNLAEAAGKYLAKGRRVFVEGRLRTDKWEDEKGKHSRTKVVADRILFLDNKTDGKAEAAPTAASASA